MLSRLSAVRNAFHVGIFDVDPVLYIRAVFVLMAAGAALEICKFIAIAAWR